MNDQRTVPNPALQPNRKQPLQRSQPVIQQPLPPTHRAGAVPVAPPTRPSMMRRPQPTKRKLPRWLWLIPVGLIGVVMLALIGGALLLTMRFANVILPNVLVGDLAVGNMTRAEAVQALSNQWTVTLSDGERTWQANPAQMGIFLDANQTAESAFAQGHGEGGLTALFRDVQVAPVVQVDVPTALAMLDSLADTFNIAPVNAGVAFVNGQAQATASQNGRILDSAATVANLQSQGGAMLADGRLELVMREVAPAVTDSAPLVAQAQVLLSSPLDLRVFDPVTGDSVYWSVLPQTWAEWLTATPDTNSPIGLSLSLDSVSLEAYLNEQASTQLDASRTIDVNLAISEIQQAMAEGRPQSAAVMIQHLDRTHIVQAGETITSIAWDYGIPYLYIMEANGGIDSVSVGQAITIPPADMFLIRRVIPNKRIEVSMSEQRTRVYENDQLIYDWGASTGISSSPTWPGVYQIISHEENAYAGNWNLWMPYFMGVYQPIPGAEFTNGFHGFPTRGGGQLLWENSIGTRVTYGCILLNNTNIYTLYQWAEEGVVVEIKP